MERGYLLLLIGAGLIAVTALPMTELMFPFLGIVVVLAGIQNMRTARKELKYAQYSAVATLVLNLVWVFLPISWHIHLWALLMILPIFFEISTFFWLFKAEYMWAPHAKKRFDWLLYTGVASIYFVFSAMIPFSRLGFSVTTAIFRLFNFLNLAMFLHYGVLIFILVKLYLESRSGSGLRRWH